MNTDKVLALAREAGGQRKRYMLSGNVVVTFLEDDLHKFVALIQQQMIEDGWCQCAKGDEAAMNKIKEKNE